MNGRCPTCGGRKAHWGPVDIIAAIHAWNTEHGKPPSGKDWLRGTWQHPAEVTVRRVFGTWNAAIAAAGFQPRRPHATRVWDRQRMVHAFFRWQFDHDGEQPTSRDWLYASENDDRPTAGQCQREFGSWNAFVVAAGYDPLVSYRPRESYERQAGAAGRVRDERGRMVSA